MSQRHQQPSSAVNGSECYYCWITQYDKCTSNCNQYRAVPRYGNFDIEPSGKMRLRTTEGNQTYTEWCEQQEAKKKRDRLMSHSRYDLIQERKWQWANRTEIADGYYTASSRAKESARFSSLVDAGVRNGTVSMPEDSSPRVTRITPSASTLTGGGSYVSSRPYYYGAERGSENVLNEGSVVSRGGGGGEVLEIRSCRKPIPAEVPYKYAHGSTKVQITPYTIATVPGSRNYRTAVEHDGQYPPQNDSDGHDGYGTTTNSSPHQNQYHARRSVSASISRGGGGSTYQPSQQRGPSPSVSRPRGSSVCTTVSRSRSTLGLVTTGYNHGKKEDGMLSAQQGGGVGRNMVGSRCTVASDIVESEILSNRYTSAHEMPLPLIFYS